MLPRATPAVSDGVSGRGVAAATVSVGLLVGSSVVLSLLVGVSLMSFDADLVCDGFSEFRVFVFVTKLLIAEIKEVGDGLTVEKPALDVEIS